MRRLSLFLDNKSDTSGNICQYIVSCSSLMIDLLGASMNDEFKLNFGIVTTTTTMRQNQSLILVSCGVQLIKTIFDSRTCD